ncbi:MAG: hypothetical protein A2X08_07010 [Bacteroidetes bacterium GWA2_32_17]|nr:MAG: hypothetical protein A2X08_07010 [Bacteroidetes bacterium GWA2_32_17]
MKKTLPFIIFFIFINLYEIKAQNWLLVDTGKTYHYSCDTTNTIFSLWADSIKINGTDTTYYTNRVILPCDTCHLQYYPGLNATMFLLKNQPLFLKRNITIINNGNIILTSPDTLILNRTAQVGNSWVFDTSASILASVYFKGLGSVLGVSDSLMGILLNSTDTIILSKNHGVIKWPCDTGSYFRLIGVEGIDTIGYHVPDSLEIYDFHEEDSFYYEDRQLWPDRNYYNSICLKVDSTFYYGNIKKYQYQYYQYGHLDDYGWNIHTWWSNGGTDSCIVLINNCAGINNDFSLVRFPIEYCRSYQDKRISSDYYSIFNLYLVNNKTVFEQLPLKYYSLVSYYGYPSNYTDILVNTDTLEVHHILIKEKQGLIENVEGFWEGGWGRIVTVQVLNGDTLTTPNSLCTYLNIKKTNELSDINIFPNPTNDIIYISGLTDGTIEIYNMLGQKVYQNKILEAESNEQVSINVNGKLNSGILIMKVASKEKSSSFKLFIK